MKFEQTRIPLDNPAFLIVETWFPETQHGYWSLRRQGAGSGDETLDKSKRLNRWELDQEQDDIKINWQARVLECFL